MATEYRTFIAPTYEEARKQMIRELGTQAYVVQKNDHVKKSWLGLKREKFVELKAGLVTEAQAHFSKTSKGLKSNSSPVTYPPVSEEFELEPERAEKLNQLKQLIRDKKANPVASKAERAGHHPRDLMELIEAAPRLDPYSPKPYALTGTDSSVGVKTKKPVNYYEEEPAAASVIDFLVEKEFQIDFAKTLARKSKLESITSDDEKFLLAKTIAKSFRYVDGLKTYATNPNVIFIIGPTGVGKTTTLSKLAVKYALQEDLLSVLVSYDGWRVMAAAQLERIAVNLGVPFRLLQEPSDLVKVIKENHQASLIFVDTGGTNFDDQKRLTDLFDLVNHVEIPKEVHLCLSASMRYKELQRMAKGFYDANFDRVLITKLDESSSLGPVLSVVANLEKPISFLSIGQNVPKDFELPSVEKMTTRLLKEWK